MIMEGRIILVFRLFAMGLWEAFSRAVYKETVLVWALGLYGTCKLQQEDQTRNHSNSRQPPNKSVYRDQCAP
jgi:hypothetical protein